MLPGRTRSAGARRSVHDPVTDNRYAIASEKLDAPNFAGLHKRRMCRRVRGHAESGGVHVRQGAYTLKGAPR